MNLRSGRKAALALATLASLGACATTDEYGYQRSADKEAGGTVAGAVIGGAAGALIDRGSGGAVVVGALLGGILGNRLGARLDERDRRELADAQYRGLDGPPGEPIEWRNPDSGNYGRFIPRTAYDRDGETCRPYESEVFIQGRREVLDGLACRGADGRWRDVNGR